MVNVNIIRKYLTPNPYSRPQHEIGKVKGIVVHWTASPMGNNRGVWNYFERRKSGTNGYGSAHFIVSLEGTIWNCIPTTEVAYHVGSSTYTNIAKQKLGSAPNYNTIGIEFCHVDSKGKMNESTWQEGAKLVAHLLEKYKLTTDDIWLHYEVVGWKDCHRYFVNNPKEYKRFKDNVYSYMNNKSTIATPTTTGVNTKNEYYTVKSGDTLWSIARNNNTTVQKIELLNKDKDLTPLKIGQTIKIKEGVKNQYQIKTGDTLWGIAMKFDTTVQKLKDLNPNVDVYALQIGEFINISEGQSTNTTDKYESILPNKVLKYGDVGEDVRKLQNALNKLYYNVGYADGSFGLKTQDALKRYQSMYYGIAENGVFGTVTRNQMLNDLLK